MLRHGLALVLLALLAPARAVYSEVYPNWGLDGWKVWVFSKPLWDPARDWRELNDDFVTGFFTEAAEPMGEYVALCEEVGRKPITLTDPETGEEQWYFFRDPEQFVRWPQEQIGRAQELLDAALAACESAESERRVRYFADSFGVTRILAARHQRRERPCPTSTNSLPSARPSAHSRRSPDRSGTCRSTSAGRASSRGR